MQKILVSACLLGDPVRYNARDKRCDDEVLQRWLREGRIVSVCPEVAGGMPVPRPSAEIKDGVGGPKVLAGLGQVIDDTGRDVTGHFLSGAGRALELVRSEGIRVAILKEGSPSCGTSFSYDGTFTGQKVPHSGVTAAALQLAGVRVFSELELIEADSFVKQLDSEDGG